MKTSAAGQPFSLRQLQAALEGKGLVNGAAGLSLVPYEPAFPRQLKYRRWHFRVLSHEKTLFHLVVGAQLGQLHARAKSFSKACPKLVCQPLQYWAQADGLEYLCLEHFAGQSLDQAVQAGQCTTAQWLEAVRKAQRILARTAQSSTKAKLQHEVQQLFDNVCASPGFSDADSKLLREHAQPLLIAGCSTEKLTLRWSNGDFVGHNLLINDRGEVRLIDYEFAAPTHFGRADWLRLFQFSIPPKALDPTSVREFKHAHKPWLEIYLWLHQLSHQRGAAPSKQQEKHVAAAISQLFMAIRNASKPSLPGKKQSFLIDSLASRQSQIETQLQERTGWAESLSAALAKARAAHSQQAKLVVERTAWAQKLNGQLKAAAEENKRLQAKLTGAKAPAQVNQREILLHFHIFKNAGTTLDAALENNLGPAWLQVEGDDPNVEMDWGKALKFIEVHPEARALSSHTLRYPPPPRLRGIKFNPLLLVRHPIDRLASIYYFERENAEGSHSETSRVAQTGSLADFVRFTLAKRPEIGCDSQTAFIGRSGVYEDPPTTEHLEAAKTAIEALPVPGVVEKLDQYLAMLEMNSSILPPDFDLARPDENRNPERAPTLLARLRKIRAQLPPRLWRELCAHNRLDLALWRFAHHLTKVRFSKLPGATERLADFRRRKALANEAARQSKDLLKQTRRAWRIADPVVTGNANQDGNLRAYALLKETADERLAWAQILEKELRSTQAEFEKLTKEYAERSAWANSLDADLQQARTAFNEESKLVQERSAWAQALDADLTRTRTAFAEQAKLVEERTTWAKALDADLERARAALAEQSKLMEERSAWALALDADLERARTALAEQTKLVEDRTAWAMALDADLLKARAALTEQTKLVEERSAWGKSLGDELLSARSNFAKLAEEHAERTAWAKAMDVQLGTAAKETKRLQAEHAKAITWAKSLDAELNQARATLVQQTKLVEERSAWGTSLGDELRLAQTNFAKLAKEHAERTAWAKKLNNELETARAALTEQTKVAGERTVWAKKLDAELGKARAAHAEQAKLVEDRTAWARKLDDQLKAAAKETKRLQAEHAKAISWAKSLDADLKKARGVLVQQTKLVEERSAWGKSLSAELISAQTNFANLTKEHAERTAWAKKLNIEIETARAALAEQAKVAGERSDWAKKLDAELGKARTAHAEQAKLVEERTAWAKSLDTELNQARAALVQQTKLVEERSAWGQSLGVELLSAQTNFAKLTKEHAERTVWAKNLDVDLQKARAAFDQQVKLVEERTTWAKSLDEELKKARAATPAALTKRIEELSAWGKSLDAELSSAREILAEQARLVQERSARAEALEAELHSSRSDFAKLNQEYAERTVWALSLDAELQRARTLFAEQSKLVEERTAWAKAIETELQKARGMAAEREQLAQQTLGALAVLRRDLVAKNVDAKATAGSLLDAELRAEAAEAEVRRLSAAQTDTLTQVNQLLRQGQLLQQFVKGLDTARQATEEKLRQLNRELARYETRLLCRLAAKRPASPALRLHP